MINDKKQRLLQSVRSYRKQAFNHQEQINILKQILINKKKCSKAELAKIIQKTLIRINEREAETSTLDKKLIDIKKEVSRLITHLEENPDAQHIIKDFKNSGVFRILYHNPLTKGQEVPDDDMLKKLLKNGFIGVATSFIIIILFALSSTIALPAAASALITGLFTGAVTYIGGILYGVVNDLFATRANLPYFLLGHQPQQASLLPTNDPIAQGVAWGVAAAFPPVLIASIIFTIITTITALFVPFTTALLPILLGAMPLVAYGAEIYAKKQMNVRGKEYGTGIWNQLYGNLNDYQISNLNEMCPTENNLGSWFANSDRNMFGFAGLPIIGLCTLAIMVILSATKALPAAIMASSLLSVTLPISVALLSVGLLTAGGAYMTIHRETQYDNRYKMDFSKSADLKPDLYLDKDIGLANTLLAQYKKSPFKKPELTAQNTRLTNLDLFKRQEPKVSSEEAIPEVKTTNLAQ